LRSHCGAQRFAYNWGLQEVQANLAQRQAERSYGIPEQQLTPPVSWSAWRLRKEFNAVKKQVAPWWAENSKEAYASGLANLAVAAPVRAHLPLRLVRPSAGPGPERLPESCRPGGRRVLPESRGDGKRAHWKPGQDPPCGHRVPPREDRPPPAEAASARAARRRLPDQREDHQNSLKGNGRRSARWSS
jgi:hypothetical protein